MLWRYGEGDALGRRLHALVQIRTQFCERDARKFVNFPHVLWRDILPLRHGGRIKAEMLRQGDLLPAMRFEKGGEVFHTSYIQSNRNSVKRFLSVGRYSGPFSAKV